MKKRNVIAPIFLLVLVFLVFLIRRWNEPVRKEVFDRKPSSVVYTKHALCRMDCRQISKEEIEEIMTKGIINFNKSSRTANPCPIFALQGRTTSGERLRVFFAQCPEQTKVITCYNLEQEFSCSCQGETKKGGSLMRYLLAPFRFVYILYAFSLFFVLMIPVFIWALLATLFGRIRGGNLVYAACKVWADIWFPLIFIRHKNIYQQKPNRGQSYIFVVNHMTYLDAAIIPKVFRHPLRPLGKVEMARIPVFGTIYRNVIVAVDRSSTGNRARSVQVLKSILRKGISVLVFPEGTFNESGRALKEFYNGAFRIAIETGTPIQPVLFLDMYDRMHTGSVFSLNPGKSRAVFLPEISVDGLTLQDLSLLKNKVSAAMEKELIRYGVSWIQEGRK